MLSRLVSLTLTLIMIAVSFNLIRQSMTLATLRDQVAEMESRLGSASPPDESRMWIKLVESGPDGCAWRLYIPPIKEFRLSMVVPDRDGNLRFGSSMGTRSSADLHQQSMIRISRTESQGKASHFISLLGSTMFSSDDGILLDTKRTEPNDALEFVAFANDGEKVLDLDTPIPLIMYRVKEEFIQARLNDGTIDQTQAIQLRAPRGWYFGTLKAMDKIETTANGIILTDGVLQ